MAAAVAVVVATATPLALPALPRGGKRESLMQPPDLITFLLSLSFWTTIRSPELLLSSLTFSGPAFS
jgi:hypothetical protein